MANLLYMKDVLAAPRQKQEFPTMGSAETTIGPIIEPIIGRYIHLDLGGRDNRIYFEEAGQGIPLVCLHTAAADGRIVVKLAIDHADEFRALIGLEASDYQLPWGDHSWAAHHPNIHGGEASAPGWCPV